MKRILFILSLLISVAYGQNTHLYKDSTNIIPIVVRTVSTTDSSYRADQGSFLKLANGKLISYFTQFVTPWDTRDVALSMIAGANSYDNGRTWSHPNIRLRPMSWRYSLLQCSAWEVHPGDVRMIALSRKGNSGGSDAFNTNFYIFKSTDDGETFSLIDSFYTGNPNVYRASMGGRIIKTVSNKLIYPFYENTGSSSSLSGIWHGRVSVSTDTGKTWSITSSVIYSPDSVVTEGGIVMTHRYLERFPITTTNPQKLIYYWRNNGNNTDAVYSIDDGVTWSAPYDLGNQSQNSTRTIMALNGGDYLVSFQNTYKTVDQGVPFGTQTYGPRGALDAVVSVDCGLSWSKVTSIDAQDTSCKIEPFFYYDSANNNVLVGYQHFDSLQAFGPFVSAIVPVSRLTIPIEMNRPYLDLQVPNEIIIQTNTGGSPFTTTQANRYPPLTSVIAMYPRDNALGGYTWMGSGNGATKDWWPLFTSKTNGSIYCGELHYATVGGDGIGGWYSGAYCFNGYAPAGGALTAMPIMTFANANTKKAYVDFDGTLATNGGIKMLTAGQPVVITEGSNSRVGQVALIAGTKAITITGLTTSSRAFVQLVSPNTSSLTVQYQAVCTSNTLTIQANIAAGTINNVDVSTLNYFVIN